MQQALVRGVEGQKSAGSAAMNQKPPLLLLIDTEGFDCNIITGISPSSPYLPKYILYEMKQCDFKSANNHLIKLGYNISKDHGENILAVKYQW